MATLQAEQLQETRNGTERNGADKTQESVDIASLRADLMHNVEHRQKDSQS